MAKYIFLEDWIKAREKVRFEALKVEASKRCSMQSSMREIEYAGLEWEVDNPKPNYTRDQLLIEIAKCLNIDLI